MANNKANIPAGEYQYGVMFDDGSVNRSWNGNTQERVAREYAEATKKEYPRDNIRLVRRYIGPWEEVESG